MKRFLRNSYVQGSVFLTLASFLVNLSNYFFHFISARVLGPSGYGEIVAFFSYSLILSVPTSALSLVVVQRVSSAKKLRIEYAFSLFQRLNLTIYRYLPLVIFSFLLFPILAKLTNLDLLTVLLLLPTIVITAKLTFYESLLQGLHVFSFFSLILVVLGLIKLASLIPIAFNIKSTFSILMLQVAGTCTVLLLITYYLGLFFKSKIKKPKAYSVFSITKLVSRRQLQIAFLSVVALSLLNNLDIIYVKKFYSDAEAGLYSSWVMFAKIIFYLVGPILQIFFVFFASNQEPKKQELVLILSLVLSLLVSILGFLGYQLFGNSFIKLLFGFRYTPIQSYLPLAAIYGGFFSSLTLFNTYFLARNKNSGIILAGLLPLYLIALFFLPKNLSSIMYLNIGFSLLVFIVYFVSYWTTRYNWQHEKSR